MKLEPHHFTRIEATATCDQRRLTVGDVRFAASLAGNTDPCPGIPDWEIAQVVKSGHRIYIEGDLIFDPPGEIEMEFHGGLWSGKPSIIGCREQCNGVIYTITATLYPKK